ncbi:MAG TPA: acetamidase/formamidase family protein, partial [Bauldia sp.]|nr:acetamidase/formamidase family protein [Bauldia sp.]
MSSGAHRTIHEAHHHFGWDRSIPPVAHIVPGTVLEFECPDASGGQLSAKSTLADVAHLDFARVNPVTGPIFVDGAQPGDALKVTLHDFSPSGWGWTANIPGFGLLAEQFTEPALHIWTYDKIGMEPAAFSPMGKVPLKPFPGTIGLAPAEPGLHSVVPPRRVGGNMDIRDLSAGTVLYLPVEVEGALFSIGDTHAAQGDGEICGTAIESPMSVVVEFDLVKGANLATPRFTTPGPVVRHLDGKGYEVTTGIGPDLMQAARDAAARMIDLLSARHGL